MLAPVRVNTSAASGASAISSERSGIRRHIPLLVLAALIAIGVAAGLLLSLGALGRESPAAATPEDSARAFAPGDQIATSFGSVSVDTADLLPGLTPVQLGMTMTHGIQSLISPDQVQVQAAVVFSNRSGHAVAYAPDMFVLRSDSQAAILPTSASVREGVLRAGTSISASLSFVAPRDGSSYWIEFREPGQARVARVFVGVSDIGPSDPVAGNEGSSAGASEGIPADQP